MDKKSLINENKKAYVMPLSWLANIDDERDLIIADALVKEWKEGAIVKLTVLNAEPKGYSRDAYSIISSVGNVIEKEISQENLIDNLQGVDALIVRLGLKINKKIIENSNGLKYIISATTGLDHIDIEVAKENNIEIISLKGEDEFLGKITSTSELTFALMLSLYRKINEAINHVKKGGWDRNLYIGNTIAGKKLGILGFGRIGKHISKYGRAFGCAVGAFDLKKKYCQME